MMRVRDAAICKLAMNSTPESEVIPELAYASIPFVGSTITTPALVAGLLSKPDRKHTEMWKNILPGVAAYRLGHRLRSQVAFQDRRFGGTSGAENVVSELLGYPTSLIAPAAIGALAGAAISKKKDRKRGAAIGGMAGTGLGIAAHLVGAITAALKKRRTARQQARHDSELTESNFFVPGMAPYNLSRRLQRSQLDRDGK